MPKKLTCPKCRVQFPFQRNERKVVQAFSKEQKNQKKLHKYFRVCPNGHTHIYNV